MTLRSRLVLALVALSTVGLGVFGVTTYTLYERSLDRRLDDQLRDAVQPLGARLASDAAGLSDGPGFPGGPQSGDGDAAPDGGRAPGGGGFGFDTYAALITGDGQVLSSFDPGVTDARPDLPDDLTDTTARRLLTTGSVSGSGRWRVLVQPATATPGRIGPAVPDGSFVVVAAPTGEIEAQMTRLLQIEVAAAVALLVALAAGAWLVLRRGLRPLEEMASSAATITAGDLSERVEPADDRTEVGQLGLALNTMLDGIEGSFRERDATEARLRQFLADASHELRTPLTSIQGFAELFRLGAERSRVDLPVIMRRIEQEAGRMRVLVEDLLLLARLDETRPSAREPVDLTVLAADACSDAVATDPDRRVTLDAPAPVVVAGDADHLRQALANLVANAIRHTPPGSPVEVATRLSDGRATVTVRDHGPGLTGEQAAHAFDRFWQADTARAGAGNGLGLAIVDGIAQEHGGRATVARAPGGGAVFTVELPAG